MQCLRALSLALVLCLPGVRGQVADVFFLCGQSNAAGRVNTGFAPDEADQTIAYYYRTDGPGGRMSTSNAKWVTLAPLATGYYGPEISLGRELQKSGYNVHLIKIAKGGAGLATVWNPSTGGQVWNWWKADSAAALKALKEKGMTVRVRGFCWLQGETDARRAIHGKAYAKNLSLFVKGVHQHLSQLGFDSSEMALIIAQIQPTAGTYAKRVRMAQQEAAKTHRRGATFDTASLKTKDGIHFDTVGNSVIGRMFARKLLEFK